METGGIKDHEKRKKKIPVNMNRVQKLFSHDELRR